jgi:uncharacterized damage-inducible protein DinB
MGKAEELLQGWLRHRKVFLELLELFDDEHLNFKPWDGAIPLGSLAVHTASSADMFMKLVKNGTFEQPANPEFKTMDDVRKIVQAYTDRTKVGFQTLEDSRLETVIEWGPFHAPGKIWLETMKDHEVHHKGQLFVYARMLGLEKLPFFIVQPPRRDS